CEKPLRDKRGGRLYCRPPNKCKAGAQKWPHIYEFPSAPVRPFVRQLSQEVPILRASKSASKPIDHAIGLCVTGHGSPTMKRDSTGTLIARLESNAGRHRLTYPCTFPILSSVNLNEAKQRAETVALTYLKLVAGINIERPELARINTANTRPHPMGPPLSMSSLPVADAPPIAPPEPFDGDPLEIPAFLRRVP